MSGAVTAPEDLQRLVRVGARALARAGLVTAFGHCSVRLDQHRFLVCAAKPMGTIRPGDAGIVGRTDAPLPEGVPGEVRIHREIYRLRPDVQAVCRIFPPTVMALSMLSITPGARSAAAIPFLPHPPLWPRADLLRQDGQAAGLAEMLGPRPAIVMRANGAVVVGRSMQEAVMLAVQLEEAARMEHLVRLHHPLPDPPGLTPDEIGNRRLATQPPDLRMWLYLTDGDPELDHMAGA